MHLTRILMSCTVLATMSLPSSIAIAQSGLTGIEGKIDRRDINALIGKVNIPYDSFTLPNGLRVLVHTDRSISRVGVYMYYDVGSKHEPAGRTGFAHLFEHLMFGGSENVPGDYLQPLMKVGATVNGNTSADRTNYFEIVPTQALDRALFMESDRMGYLLGALRQDRLDGQRGVVKNEKREHGNSPYTIVNTVTRETLYPVGHPYRHETIGSMRDLDAATLNDVRSFFKAHYGPNNATLVLTGDIDVATAKRLVVKYFGNIPAGPRNVRPDAGSVPLSKTIVRTVTAPVTTTTIYRTWPVPGDDSPDSVVLNGLASLMSGDDNPALQRDLVRDRKLFRSIGASNNTSAQAGQFVISGTVREGVNVDVARAALDAAITASVKRKFTTDQVDKLVAGWAYSTIRGMEDPLRRGAKLGESAAMSGSPDQYRVDLQKATSLTPNMLSAAAHRWLDRPRLELTLVPGPRMTAQDDADTPAPAAPTSVAPAVTAGAIQPAIGTRGPLPAVGPTTAIRFPVLEHARLANGIPVIYARHDAIPLTSVGLEFQGGKLAGPDLKPGVVGMMYGMMADAYDGHDDVWLRARNTRLGLNIGAGADDLYASVGFDAPDSSLDKAAAILTSMLTTASFRPESIDRIKRETIDTLRGNRLDPEALLRKAVAPLMSPGSPHNRTLSKDAAEIKAITRQDLVDAYHRLVRPENAVMRVISSRPLAELLPVLNDTVGRWKAVGQAQPIAPPAFVRTASKPEIVLIDLPGSVTATIVGGQPVSMDDRAPREAVRIANVVFGNGFTSRLNMNLREDKHWSYGVGANFGWNRYGSTYSFSGAVQPDKVGDAIAEVRKELRDVTGDRPLTQKEFTDAQITLIGAAPGRIESKSGIADGMSDILKYDRPDDYPAKTIDRLKAVTLDEANAALRAQLDSKTWVWGIVGDAKVIRPQLDALGLPVRVLTADQVLPPI